MNEEQIIELIQKGQLDKAFIKLYILFPKIRSILRKYGCSKEQAYDIFQDALEVFYHKLQKENFKIETSVESYVMNTCKFMYLKSQRNKQNLSELYDQIPDTSDLEQVLMENNKVELAETAFQQLGEKCKEILLSFYFGNLSMVEIAKKFSFSSEHVARTQKYKCLESARTNYINLTNLQK